MVTESFKQRIQSSLAKADIRIGGARPWDLRVHNEQLYPRVFTQGALGLGEAYMDGWWECERLDAFFYRILDAEVDRGFRINLRSVWAYLRAYITNMQNSSRAYDVGREHYDRGNDLYGAMLDDRLVYTGGDWHKANTLSEAQEAKLDRVCRKLNLRAGQSVLDIGCGWASFARYAAENYGANVTGVTISEEQAKLGRKRCEGLPVEIRLQDYRRVEGRFDHIVSLGMFEHVGYKNYNSFMQTAYNHLKRDGLFLLYCIGGNRSVRTSNPWTTKYIFPNSMIPSIRQIGDAIEKLFVMEQWDNVGCDYDRTLMAWHKNFEEAWPKLKNNYSERFYRMWKY